MSGPSRWIILAHGLAPFVGFATILAGAFVPGLLGVALIAAGLGLILWSLT